MMRIDSLCLAIKRSGSAIFYLHIFHAHSQTAAPTRVWVACAHAMTVIFALEKHLPDWAGGTRQNFLRCGFHAAREQAFYYFDPHSPVSIVRGWYKYANLADKSRQTAICEYLEVKSCVSWALLLLEANRQLIYIDPEAKKGHQHCVFF